MLKLVVILLSVTFSTVQSVRECDSWLDYATILPNGNCRQSQVANKNITEIVRSWGHTAEEHYVTTEDGYILFMLRVYKNITQETPILLAHGIAMDAGGFVLRGNKSLAYNLSMTGYEVWLISFRGARNSMAHTTLSNLLYPYWNFSFDEMIKYDIVSGIEKVYNETGKKMKYIGFSLGGGIGLGCAAAYPEFIESRITSITGLAPGVYYPDDVRSAEMLLIPFMPALMAVDKYIFQGHFFMWLPLFAPLCSFDLFTMRFCSALAGIFLGEDWDGADPLTLPVFFNNYTNIIAAKNQNHIFQTYQSKIFCQYDYGAGNLLKYGQLTPPEYDLTKVPVPVSLYSGKNDFIITPTSCEQIKEKVEVRSCCKHHIIADEKFCHIDFTENINIEDSLYSILLPELETLDDCVLD